MPTTDSDDSAVAGRDNRLEVILFGEPRVELPGRVVHLSPFQLALLLLVYTERRLSRSDAAWLLWEEDDSPRIRQRIRQLRHMVNQRAGGPLIDAEDDHLLAADAFARSDIAGARERIRNGPLREAGDLIARGLGAELPVVPTEEYEDWLNAQRVSLERQLSAAASAQWDDAAPAGEWEQARDAAEALYSLDPGDVPTVLRVIEARARLGKVASAEAAYALYNKYELSPGEQADERVLELIDRVRALDESGKSVIGGFRRRLPLIGRDEEMRSAREVVEKVEDGELRVILVRGESGIGKTRLLTEIQTEATLAGFQCLSAQPVELEKRIPLNPLVDALMDCDIASHLRALGDPWRAVIGTFFPESALDGPISEIPPIQESSLSRRLMDAFWLLFDRLANIQPTMLLIDDLQWADATTLGVLQFIQRRWDGGPLAIVVAVRPELLGKMDPAEQFIGVEEGNEVCRIDLGELDQASARALVMEVTEGQIDDDTADRLCEMAAHHPFYLTELATEVREGGVVVPGGVHEPIPVPDSVRRKLDEKMADLSIGARNLIRILSVFARQMRVTEVAGYVGAGTPDPIEHLEELEGLGLIVVDRGLLRISHDLIRGTVYTGMTGTRRASLHQRIANEIQEHEHLGSHAEMAVHFSRSGDAHEAVRCSVIAAREAAGRGAPTEAATLLRIAVENETNSARRSRLLADLGVNRHLSRDLPGAAPALRHAGAELRRHDDHHRARRMEIREVECMLSLGSPAESLYDRLTALKGECREVGDGEALSLSLEVELHVARQAGHSNRALDVLDQMRNVALRGDAAAVCIAHMALALGVLYGEPRGALRSALIAVRMSCGRLERYRLKALSRLYGVLITQGLCNLPKAKSYIAEAESLADSCGDVVLRYGLQTNLGVAALDSGDLDRAEVELSRGADPGGASIPMRRLGRHLSLGELHVQRAEYGEAQRAFATASTCLSGSVRTDFHDLVRSGLGYCALELGEIGEARRLGELLSENSPERDLDPYLIVLFKSRLLETRGQREKAIELVQRQQSLLEGRLVLAWLKLCALEGHLLRRAGRRPASPTLTRALSVSGRLNLDFRHKELLALLGDPA